MLVAHLTNDEKFIDGFIEIQQRLFPEITNVYFVLSEDGTFRHVSSKNIVAFSGKNDGYQKIREQLGEDPHLLVIHGLNPWKVQVLLKMPLSVKVAWIFYGFEIYNRGENVLAFVGPKTKQLAFAGAKHKLKLVIRKLQYSISRFSGISGQLMPFRAALNRINYFAHWIPQDFDYLTKRYPNHAMEFVDFCYSIEPLRLEVNDHRADLLIGNSAADTNNHADIIESLSDDFISGFKRVIIPLSYSGEQGYVKAVKKLAQEKLGDKALVLDSFMKKEEYFDILKGVKLAIMGQLRSQGAANIRFFLSSGIDLAMYPENSIYRFYTEKGMAIHSINQLNTDGFTPFAKDVLEHNKTIEHEIHRGEAIQKFYANLLKINEE